MSGAAPSRLFMTTDSIGGVWTYVLELAAALAPAGVRTALAVLGPAPTAAQAEAAAQVRGLAVIDTRLPLDWTAASVRELEAAAQEVARLAGAAKAEVVQLNSPALAAFGPFPAPVLVACHSCVATWWSAVRGGPMPDDFGWRTALTSRGYRAADALVAPSAAFAAATQAAYGLRHAPRVVWNGRAAARPAPAPGAPDAFVLAAGRLWDDGKNLDALDRAAARLSAPVLAAGPLAAPGGAPRAFANLRWLGDLASHDLAAWMAAAPVFASPALYEPFGLTVLEAAQAGCALVLSDIPTFRELWDGTALFVDPADDAALASALERLLADEAQRAALSRAAHARAARYAPAAMADGMLGLYRKLIRPPAEAAA